MKPTTKKISFVELALRYKTITKKQMEYANILFNEKKKKNPDITMEKILIEEGFATQEQINILNLILDFLKLKEKSRKFGDIAVKMGFATQNDIDNALQKQHIEFKRSKTQKEIGDILVEAKIITPAEKNLIAAEQQKLSGKVQSKKTRNKPVSKDMSKQKLQKTAGTSDSDVTFMEILFSEDEMDVWIRLSDDTGKKITLNEIKNEIQNKGVVYGIYNDCLLQCKIDKNKIKAGKKFFQAARGRFPAVSKNKTVKYLFNTAHDFPDDFNEVNRKVRKGMPIAVLNPDNTDSCGKTVFGRQIDSDFYGNHAPRIFRCGKGAEASDDDTKAFAGRSGFPFLSMEKKLYVLSFINVLEDADLKFGPIEDFSNINVGGILTGAFPVKAGRIKAREIRETNIYALENIVVEIGITNAKIITQGNVYAKYIHNSNIEAFGNIIVEHEIIDSTIICSGKCEAVKSRIIASTISAKQGIICGGAGSDPTEACILMAGREDHIINETDRLTETIEFIKKEKTDLENKRNIVEAKIKKIFKKMTDLKLLYDRAKFELNSIDNAPGKKFSISDKDSYIKTMELRDKLEKKMETIINSLKQLNKQKHKMKTQKYGIEKRIKKIKPKIEKKIIEKKLDMENLFQWAEKSPAIPEIIVKGRLAQGTILKGLFSTLKTEEEYKNIKAVEVQSSEPENSESTIVIEKN